MPLLGFWLAYRATSLLLHAVSAALFIACDPLLWVLSRMAMLDVYVTCFALAAFFFGYEYLQAGTARARAVLGTLTGTFLGLACASKWNAVSLLLGLGTLCGLARRWQVSDTSALTNGKRSSYLSLLFFFAGLPVLTKSPA